MDKENIFLDLPPDAPIMIRGYARGGLCSCDLAISSANAIERLINANRPTGYGPLTRNFSRNETKYFPDERVWWAKHPESSPEAAANSLSIRNIREKYLEEIRGFVENDTLKTAYITRLLDKPGICDWIIRYVQERDQEELDTLILAGPYRYRQNELPRTINQTQHRQSATLGSYISRAFAPNDLHAIEKRPGQKGNKEQRDALIRALPIDPDKIAEETLIKLGLAPDDFMTYTLQARRRYTLAVRKRFLTIFSQAKEVKRGPGLETARILEVTREDGQKKIAIFRTVTELEVEFIETSKPRKRFHKISKTYCNIYENIDEALRSQIDAVTSIDSKIIRYTQLLVGFRSFEELLPKVKSAYLSEALETCKKQKSFYDRALVKHLSQYIESKNPLLLGHIITKLERALEDTKRKKAEISSVCTLLEASQEN